MPTLSLSTALSSGSPAPAAPALAPAPVGEALLDGFAAMLDGLTVALPQDGDSAGAAPQALPKTLPLPQVRQDPAVWLPDEGEMPEVAAVPGPGLPPAKAGCLVFGPDCEMPAADPGDPRREAVRGAPSDGAPPPLPCMPKSWPLRLSSALTPTRTGAAAEPDGVPAATTSELGEKPSAGQETIQPDLPTITTAVLTAPVQPPIAVPAQDPSTTEHNARAETPTVAVQASPGRALQDPRSAKTAEALPIARPQAEPQSGPDQQAQGNQHGASASALKPGPHLNERLAPELARKVAELVEQVAPPQADSRAPISVSAPAPAQAPAPLAQPQPSVDAAAPTAPAAQSAPVDLGRAEWVQAMVDRIAELPQADGKREAQIKLLPDALGRVEVKIVERDERLQVTLNADTAQARQMLSDAAPRLQELGDARGLRFAQPEVGGGASQERRSAPDQQQPHTPQRPRPAPAARDADPQPQGDLIA